MASHFLRYLVPIWQCAQSRATEPGTLVPQTQHHQLALPLHHCTAFLE